jgi:hypothetical protein
LRRGCDLSRFEEVVEEQEIDSEETHDQRNI